METDRNLLFGVLALQADLIDTRQFIEACTLWTARKDASLADLLMERGWIVAEDRSHVEYLLERKLQRHGGDARAGLASVDGEIKRSLAALGDADIHRSLASLPEADGSGPTATVDFVPTTQERYSLVRLHASGGIGRVWLARDSYLDREIALKELRPERADDSRLWARFLQEAQITGQLEHPGIVPVYELARRPDSKQPFYTMRFVNGRTLNEGTSKFHAKRAAGESDSFEFLTLVNAFVTVCNTIAYAHSRGVLHRDLKGQNVILGDFGEVVVLDWGLAKRMDHDEFHEPLTARASGGNGEPNFTLQGQALGTPAYMAPEQAAGRLDEIDCRTDVYGLGAMLYEILTGQPPLTGSDTLEILRKVIEEKPPSPRQHWPELPPALEAVCLRAISKRPGDRYAEAGELAQQVQQWQDEELRKSRHLLQAIVDNSTAIIFVKDTDGRYILANRWYERLFHVSQEEVVGNTDLDIFPTEIAEAFRANDRKVIEAGKPLEFEERAPHDGGIHTYISLKFPIYDSSGKPYAVCGIATNITDRKRAEEALRESEERYRSVIAAMQDGFVLLDADGSIRSCNASAERILGLSADQMMGRTPLDPRWGAIREDGSAFPDEDRPPIVTLRTGKPCSNVIMGVRRPDGALTWLCVNSQPLFQADGVTLAGVVAGFSDTTERQRLQEALRQSEALYHSLVETLPLCVWRKDRAGKFTFGSERFCKQVLNKPEAEIIGKTDYDFFFPREMADQYRDNDAKVLSTGEVLKTTETTVTPEGEELVIQVVKAPVLDAQGTIVGTQGIFWDITERVRLEEALEKTRAELERVRQELTDAKNQS